MTKTKKLIERIRITGTRAEYEKALHYMEKHGYKIVHGGSRRVGFKIDYTRFVIVAEREVGEIDFSRQDIPEKDKQEIAKTVMQILSRTLIAEPVRNEKLLRASAEVKHKTGVSVNFIMKGATE